MRKILHAIFMILLLASFSACGGGGRSADFDFRLAEGCPDSISLLRSASGEGVTVLLQLENKHDGFVEGALEYDPQSWMLTAAEPAGDLADLLLVSAAEKRGAVRFAAALPGGASFAAGPLASFIFMPGSEVEHELSRVGNAPTDLAASVAGNHVSLTWTENLPGDCDANGQVSGSDLFQIALAFNTHEGDELYIPEADCNRDGSVNGMDVFVIASNFTASIDDYDVYRRVSGQGEYIKLNDAPVERANYGAGYPPQSQYSDTVPGPNTWDYAVSALNTPCEEESPLSEPLIVTTEAAPTNSLLVAPGSPDVALNGTLELAVLVNEVTDLIGVSLVLDYDTSRLDFIDYRTSDDFFSSSALYMQFGEGDPTVFVVVTELAGQAGPHSGSGETMTLIFRAVATGEAFLSLRGGDSGCTFSDPEGTAYEPGALVSSSVTVFEGGIEPPDDPDDVEPPSNLAAEAGFGYVGLAWDAGAQEDLIGYNVYSAGSEAGPFSRLNGEPVAGLDYIDISAPDDSTTYYKVSAVAEGYLESSLIGPAAAQALPIEGNSVYVRAERLTYGVGEIIQLEIGVGQIEELTGASATIEYDSSLEFFNDLLAWDGPFDPLIYFPTHGEGYFTATLANQGMQTSSGEGPLCRLELIASQPGVYAFEFTRDISFTSLQDALWQLHSPSEYYGFTVTVE